MWRWPRKRSICWLLHPATRRTPGWQPFDEKERPSDDPVAQRRPDEAAIRSGLTVFRTWRTWRTWGTRRANRPRGPDPTQRARGRRRRPGAHLAAATAGRSRYAGVLPELRLMAERRFARTESVDLGSPTDATALAPVGIDSNNDVRYQARATWDLSKIIFNPDEIGAQFQALRTADARREVESLVIRLYFERRRLKAESAAADDQDMPSGLRRELRIAEVEAELDALTGGAFVRLARHPPIGGESWPPP